MAVAEPGLRRPRKTYRQAQIESMLREAIDWVLLDEPAKARRLIHQAEKLLAPKPYICPLCKTKACPKAGDKRRKCANR